MKTYKETLHRKWRKLQLFCNIPFFSIIGIFFFTDRWEYLLLLLPILLISNFFGGVTCPDCENRIAIPPAPKGFKALNYCGECGFDLNKELPKVWARFDTDAPKKLDESQMKQNEA